MDAPQEKVRFQCPNCSAVLQVPAASVGKTARCPRCQKLSPVVVMKTARKHSGVNSNSGTELNRPSDPQERTRANPPTQNYPHPAPTLEHLPPTRFPSAVGGQQQSSDYWTIDSRLVKRNRSIAPLWLVLTIGAVILGGMGVTWIGYQLITSSAVIDSLESLAKHSDLSKPLSDTSDGANAQQNSLRDDLATDSKTMGTSSTVDGLTRTNGPEHKFRSTKPLGEFSSTISPSNRASASQAPASEALSSGASLTDASSNQVGEPESASPKEPLPAPTLESSTQAKVYLLSCRTTIGSQMQVRVYVPAGTHPQKSLACVFIAPAGTTLLSGASLESSDNLDEVRPFIQAGMSVACYSIDGSMNDISSDDPRYMSNLSRAFREFTSAEAGILNGKEAIARVIRDFPEIDPGKLYTSGHSSAATLALLVAANDSRVSKCLAFAPVADLNQRFDGILNDRSILQVLPGLDKYLVFGSPVTHASKFKAKVWIAHARNDDNVPYRESEELQKAIQSSGGHAQLHLTNSGGHYGEFLYANIPAGINWLKSE